MDGTNQTACQFWVTIEDLFQANKAPRAIFLSHEFHSMTQGDLSINDYCNKMKTAADALHGVGHPISEPSLVLNLLCGLNKCYSNTADNIAGSSILTFTTARNQLVLKELWLANEEKNMVSTALVTSCGSGGCRQTSSKGDGPFLQQCKNGQKHNKKGGKRGNYDG